MPEEVKLVPDDSPCESPEYCADLHQQHRLLHEREMSRSESSSCSEESACCKLNGLEGVEIIPTRTLKTSVPKPAANPLQFVKIGPCELYRSAQQQLQKVGEVKKPKKEVRDEIEDWQSNLDNWKCSRRKQQEHIIERVVEVKKLELEEHDRNRRRTKTFSEMMEERTSKGRKLSLPVYLDENAEDLSDLGLSSIKNTTKSSSPIPEEPSEHKEKVGSDGDEATCRTDEATYESAIQSYETRMKTLANGGVGSGSGCGDGDADKPKSAPPLAFRLVGGPRKFQGRRASAAKIEEKLGELERVKNRSVSSNDLSSALEANKKSLGIPKVNIFARKELFERKSEETAEPAVKCGLVALSEEVPRVRSIKERLSSLEKSVEEGNKPKNTTPLADISVRDRLSSINEKLRTQSVNGLPETSVPSPASCVSNRSSARTASDSPLRAACLLRSTSGLEYETGTRPKEEDTKGNETSTASVSRCNREYSSSGRSSSSEDYENVAHHHHHHHHHRGGHHFHHRSLDSLQGRDSPNGFCFERVQSLECVDCYGSNYPASVLSGDTDRDDSGIHTADVSSSVSQADDFDLHADSSIDTDVKGPPLTPASAGVTIVDGVATCRTNVRDSSQSGNCPSHDPFAAGGLPPPATKVTDVTDVRRYDTPNERGDASTTNDIGGQPQPSKNGNSTEISSPRSLAQLDDPRPPACVANKTVARVIRDTGDESPTIGQLSEPSKICQPMADALHSIDQNLIVQNKLDADESRQQCKKNNAAGSSSGSGSAFRSTVMATECESALVSGLRRITNVGGDEMGDHYSNPRSLSSAPDGLVAVQSAAVFAFELPMAAAEPPKEKPPPPPLIDNSDDDESDVIENCDLRRVDSTKRIKKEIRLKRSSFLGIEGNDDDNYLEPALGSVKRPPDMRTFLQEERRLEKLLYRQSICSESDSTMGESRDSGVELDKNHIDEHSWITEDTHSRQDSEIYANTSIASEEDEIIRKEREILEILELEERRNCGKDYKNDYGDLGEKLVLKLKELEGRKAECRWNRERENQTEQPNVPIRSQSQPQKQRQLPDVNLSYTDPATLSHQTQRVQVRSLQDVSRDLTANDGNGSLIEYDEQQLERDYPLRSSMPNILQEPTTVSSPYHRVPPPVPPNKPRQSRKSGPTIDEKSCPQQMTKQTLQALSAVPRSKIIATDSWVLSKKKPRQEAYNYQHWLIQEAEHRRITEYHQRYGSDNGYNNSTNALLDNIDGTMLVPPNDTTPLDSRSSAHHPGRYPRVHSQMLPSYRNHNRPFVDDKKPTKSLYKPLPDSVIQTLTQRVQSRLNANDTNNKPKRRENYSNQQEKMLSVSGKKKCSHCGEELGRGAAMIIESLRLFYHIDCFKCCVCCVQLGDGLMGTDVRVRNSKLHCHSCYSNDEGLKFSCV